MEECFYKALPLPPSLPSPFPSPYLSCFQTYGVRSSPAVQGLSCGPSGCMPLNTAKRYPLLLQERSGYKLAGSCEQGRYAREEREQLVGLHRRRTLSFREPGGLPTSSPLGEGKVLAAFSLFSLMSITRKPRWRRFLFLPWKKCRYLDGSLLLLPGFQKHNFLWQMSLSFTQSLLTQGMAQHGEVRELLPRRT